MYIKVRSISEFESFCKNAVENEAEIKTFFLSWLFPYSIRSMNSYANHSNKRNA